MAAEGVTLVAVGGASLRSRAIMGVNISPAVTALLLLPLGGATENG